jgi:hypothetical protein
MIDHNASGNSGFAILGSSPSDPPIMPT